MDNVHVTRRTLIGAGAALGGSALLPGPVLAAARPAIGELAVHARDLVPRGGWHTSRVLHARRRFELLGLTWSGARDIGAQVRVRTAQGWTEWIDLRRPCAHAPDRHRRTGASDPVWTGPASWVQVRTRRRAALRVHLVDGGSDPRGSGGSRPAARSSQNGPPPIISRHDWGGDDYPPRTDPSYGEVHLAFVHHTVTANDYGPQDSAGIVRSICAYHRNVNKWNDIGYNFLVDRYGQVFEGRAGGIDRAVIGAQAQGYNSQSTGIACLGTFQDTPLDDAGIDAVSTLIAWKLPLHGCPVTGEVVIRSGGGDLNRYPSGTRVTFQRISGHRDGDSTECPGDQLYGQLDRIRALAAQRAGTPVGSAPPTVTLAVGAPEVVYPARVKVTGTVQIPDAPSPEGAKVAIESRAPGAGWKPVKTVAAAADGSFAASFRPDGNVEVRARLAQRSAASAIQPVAVRPAMSIACATKRIDAGERAVVSGRLRPAAGPVTVTLEQRQPDGSYASAGKRKVTVRDGRWSARIKPPAPGLYRLRARFAGTPRLSKARSDRVYVRVGQGHAAGGQPAA